MQIKTFRALDMRDALRAVKEELGPEAVILSTREVKSGGGAFGLFSRAVVEVTAAVDRGGARRSGQEPARAGSGREGAMPPGAGGWKEGARRAARRAWDSLQSEGAGGPASR